MTVDEAEKYADKMTYREAIENALSAKCVPYRRATLTKLHRLLKKFDENVDVLDKISAEIKENMSWEMYDEYGNETALCKELMDIIEKYKGVSE